jgi:hypothetical protein
MGVELELAVVRGREYLARAVFRPAAQVSLGSNPRATVSLSESELPEHVDLLELRQSGVVLNFDRSSKLELQADGRSLSTAQILGSGRARETSDGFQVDFALGSKGVVHFGGLRVLLKLQAERDVTIWSASGEAGTACGGCTAPLPWAVAGPGALTPCRVCGDLNRVEGRAMFEAGATAVVQKLPPDGTTTESPPLTEPDPRPLYGPTRPLPIQVAAAASRIDQAGKKGTDLPTFDAIQAKKSADLPTFDSIQAKKGADLPTFDSIQAKKGADLPTFDAIQAKKGADLPTFDSIQAKKGADLPTFDSIQAKKSTDLPTFDAIQVQRGELGPDGEATVPPETAAPLVGNLAAPSHPLKGADLPTFDAISVIKRNQVLSTQAAIKTMKREPESPSGTPNIAASSLPSGLQLQPTGAMPVRKDTGEVAVAPKPPPVRLGSEPTPIVVPRGAANEARALLRAYEGGADVDPREIAPTQAAFDNMADAVQKISAPSLKPVLSRGKKLPSEDELLAGRMDPAGTTNPPPPEPVLETRLVPSPTGKLAPPVRESVVEEPEPGPPSRDGLDLPPSDRGVLSAPAPSTRPVGTPATQQEIEDDFLMGRDDGGIGTRDNTGWLLIGFGLVSGLLGMGLILYVFLQ